ncbi:type I-F CRISPR-associated protein Csy1 [Lelliottia amnigena]
MSEATLTAFIAEYIAGRRQTKLETFDKEAAKRSDADIYALAEERRELELRYEPVAWLTDAAKRAGQISLVTHVAKFAHGDSRSSSILIEKQDLEGYLNSSTIPSLIIDASGNAAALDVAKFLQIKIDGYSLLDRIRSGNYTALEYYAKNIHQLEKWVSGFLSAVNITKVSSHKLAKQIYFPVGTGYHLLGPLFSTSFAHEIYHIFKSNYFSEETKVARKALRDKSWHSGTVIFYPEMVKMHFGGSNPQGISALNTARRGEMHLLSCEPPKDKVIKTPPRMIKSIFAVPGSFNNKAAPLINHLTDLLSGKTSKRGAHLHKFRDDLLLQISNLLFDASSGLQRKEWQGWTTQCPDLVRHQKLWLDPWQSKIDEDFKFEREKGDWKELVIKDFSLWVNYRLGESLSDLGETERREWERNVDLLRYLRLSEKMIEWELK